MKFNFYQYWNENRNKFTRYAKYVFPIVLVFVVALVVMCSLRAHEKKVAKLEEQAKQLEGTPIVENTELDLDHLVVPLVPVSDAALQTMIKDYYRALSEGDSDAIRGYCDIVEETDMYRFEEQSKYLNYEVKDIYTQDGPETGSYIAYAYCDVIFDEYPENPLPAYNGFYIRKDESGSFQIVKGELTEDENAYISVAAAQDDVIELNNRVTVEYNETVMEHPELLDYLGDLDSIVSAAIGEKLAAMTVGESESGETLDGSEAETTTPEESTGETETETEPAGPKYAKATTTVNVRSSDSENADKLGKVSGGTKLEIVDIQLNGWTKVIYNGKNGFIKSEFLELEQNASDFETIGTVTANTNVNVRASANEKADRLGILAGGDTVDLIARENGWCKIKYNGQIGYIKEDFVE